MCWCRPKWGNVITFRYMYIIIAIYHKDIASHALPDPVSWVNYVRSSAQGDDIISPKPGDTDRTTQECIYRSHSRERSHRLFTPIPLSHTIRTVRRRIYRVFTAILTRFAHCSHTIRTGTGTPYPHTIRTVAQYSHGSHTILYSRHCHTKFAHICTSSHPGHTRRAVGASPFAVFALIHAVFAQFTPVRICECAISTL